MTEKMDAYARDQALGDDRKTSTSESWAAWLIERGQPEGQSPTLWWTGSNWIEAAESAWRYGTREEAEAEIDAKSGIKGLSYHGVFGRAVEHVFVKDQEKAMSIELTYEQRSRADDLYADCCREDNVLLNATYELICLRDRQADTATRITELEATIDKLADWKRRRQAHDKGIEAQLNAYSQRAKEAEARHQSLSDRHWTCCKCGGQWICDRADVPKDRGNSTPVCGCPYCEVQRLRFGLNQIAWPAAYGLPSEPTVAMLRHVAQDALAIGVPVANERAANPPAVVLAKLVLDIHRNPTPPGERMNAVLSIAQNIIDDAQGAEHGRPDEAHDASGH